MTHRSRRPLARSAAALATLALGAAALSGCAPGADDGSTELSFFSWDNEATMTPIIDAFEAANPGITVEFSSAPPVAEYISTLQTRLVGGTGADVFAIAAENKTNLIDAGYVKDLTDEPFMSAMSPFNTETYGRDGRAYGMSTNSWAGGLLVNEQLLADAGVTEIPTSWDDFLDVLEDVKASGVTPLYDGAGQIPMTVAAMVGAENAAAGGDVDAAIFSGDAEFAELWDEPLAAYQELFDRDLMSQDVISLTGDQIVDEFVNGRVAIMTAGPWNVPAVREAAPDMDISFSPVPTPTGDAFWAGAASPGYAINAKSENTEAAEAFLTFLGSEEGVSLFQKETAALTTTDNFTPEIDPALQPNLEGLQSGDFYLPQIAWPRYQDALNTDAVAQIQLMIQGSATPADVSAALQTRLQEQEG